MYIVCVAASRVHAKPRICSIQNAVFARQSTDVWGPGKKRRKDSDKKIKPAEYQTDVYSSNVELKIPNSSRRVAVVFRNRKGCILSHGVPQEEVVDSSKYPNWPHSIGAYFSQSVTASFIRS